MPKDTTEWFFKMTTHGHIFARTFKERLEALNWDVLPHPRYSPDIDPSDYHLFSKMTHGLAE
jgi:hypothetical protein